jgi:hypothetical protein
MTSDLVMHKQKCAMNEKTHISIQLVTFLCGFSNTYKECQLLDMGILDT